jgi:mono/diheme cytochrome c family protein
LRAVAYAPDLDTISYPLGYHMYMRMGWAALLAALTSGFFTSFLIAQDSPPIWAGVYTTAQADRGRAVVEAHCGECHHDDLSGGEGPALVGPTFMLKWEMQSIERLFHKIRDTMPEVGSTVVTEAEKLDTVAYILQQNGFPAGSKELTEADGALAALRMIPRGGPSPPRSGALVQAVGCLRESPGKGWMLTESTDPQITTRDPLSAADKQALSTVAQGTQTVDLIGVYAPGELAQNTVVVKGLFVKTATRIRINVTSMELVHLQCGK